jgi:uncharacterized membrane protein required for colicin V production
MKPRNRFFSVISSQIQQFLWHRTGYIRPGVIFCIYAIHKETAVPMNLNDLPFNLFDVAFVGILVCGILRGRKHGMSEELMSLLKWMAVVIACSIFYEPVGVWMAQSTPFSLLSSYIFVYAGGAMLILAVFGLLKNQLGGKLVGSDIFGRSEYYLGMGSGFVRFACMTVAVLALLNATYISPAQVQAMEHFQNDMYGSNYFPTLHTAQAVVFEKSLTGGWIREHLGFLLIKPTAPEDKSLHQKEASLP